MLNLEVSCTNQLRYVDVKKAVAEMLGLMAGSDKIFGLFKLIPSPFIIPKKLCFDSDIVTASSWGNEEFGFLQLSFSKKEELRIIRRDRVALNLIYWEAMNLHEVGSTLGDPEKSLDLILKSLEIKGQPGLDLIENRVFVPQSECKQVQLLNREKSSGDYIKLASDIALSEAYISRISLGEKKKFLNSMYKISKYYWCYFYKVLECTLCGEYALLLSTCLGVNEEFFADIIMNSAHLSLLSYCSTKDYRQLLYVPWCNIRCVTKSNAREIFSFQMLYEDRDGYVSYITISACSRQYDYIYSMSIYFLKKQCSIFKERGKKHGFAKKQLVSYKKFLSISLPSGFFIPVLFSSKLSIPQQPINLQISDHCFINSSFVPALLDAQNAYINSSLQQEYKKFHIPHKSCKQRRIIRNNRHEEKRGIYHKHFENSSENHALLVKGLAEAANDREAGILAIYKQCWEELKCSNTEALRCRRMIDEITVFTFGNELPLKINISRRMTTIGELKKEVGRQLNLVPKSLDIFGLFTCSDVAFQEPILLCLDTNELPPNALCFRRFSFSKGLEKTVCKRDLVALKLLFCEAKYMLENKLFHPQLAQEDFDRLKYLADLALPHTSPHHRLTDTMEQFMEALTTISPCSWWEYYYRVKVSGCNLSDWLDSCDVPLTSAALSINHLTLTDSTATFTAHIPWHRVSSILMQDSGATVPEQLKLEIVNDKMDEKGQMTDKVLAALPIDTINVRFFFSVTRHILDLYNQKQRHVNLMGRERLPSSHFHNSTFKGPGYVFYFPDPVMQHINEAFIGLNI